MTMAEAIISGNLEAVKKIQLENPSCIDELYNGITLPNLAASTGNTEIFKYIVEYSRASFNETDDDNRTVLFYAVPTDNVELVKYIVERLGFSGLSGDRNLVTPYDIAIESGAKKVISYFKELYGDIDGMYRNPIRTGMHPDPSIVCVGDDFYMVNSSFIYFPCIPISHSKDLIHWEIIGHAITNPEWAYINELEGGRGYWAPDISYYNGRFYITATYRLNDTGTVYRRQMVVSSDKPEGPYCKPSFIDEDGIDPSIFTDDDGRRYMLLNRGARIFEISSDGTRQLSPAALLYYGSQKRAPEGSHLLKKDSWYYLFQAEGGTGEGHRITVARSRSLFGVYEPCPFNPIMRQNNPKAGIQRCGHGKPVKTPNGEWFIPYLCGRQVEGKYSLLGRETALDRITWTADGWPMVNNLEGPSTLAKKPNLPEHAFAPAAHDSFGSGDNLSPVWSWVRVPEPDAYKLISKGTDTINYIGGNPIGNSISTMADIDTHADCSIHAGSSTLLLRAGRTPLSTMYSRNILVRPQEKFCFTITATLSLDSDVLHYTGGEAGVTCYYDENTYLTFNVVNNNGRLLLKVSEHIDTVTTDAACIELDTTPAVTASAHDAPVITASSLDALSSGSIIEFKIDTRYLRRDFSYQITDTSNMSDFTGSNAASDDIADNIASENDTSFTHACTLENVYYLCDEGLKKGKRFTGAMHGMYAYLPSHNTAGSTELPEDEQCVYAEFISYN